MKPLPELLVWLIAGILALLFGDMILDILFMTTVGFVEWLVCSMVLMTLAIGEYGFCG